MADSNHTLETNEATTPEQPLPAAATYNQQEEAAKAIRFMLIKAAIFILIPVIASALAVFFLL